MAQKEEVYHWTMWTCINLVLFMHWGSNSFMPKYINKRNANNTLFSRLHYWLKFIGNYNM